MIQNLNTVSEQEILHRQGVYLPKYEAVRHLIEAGALVYTCLDLETTDKDWKSAEITVASLTITDIGYNLISDDLYEVCVPDRVGLSPEAMLITRYMASKLRKEDRLSPQHAVSQIYEAVQDAPKRLWTMLGSWKEKLGADLWEKYVDEKTVLILGKNGNEKEFLVRHYPLLDKNNKIIKSVRVHEPRADKNYMEMSYLTNGREAADYEDDQGRWKIKKLDKYNMGFRNTFFDNRLMAAALFRANFPHKQIYALNRKALGNHAIDVFTIALSSHFFGQSARKLNIGYRIDPETTREKISAKLDLLMEENTRRADVDTNLPEGVRVYDGSLHNLKRGHNAPDYDNAKALGLHRYIRDHEPGIMAHIENCSHVDYFRNFMTLDNENGIPTTHPIRFGIISVNDDKIYRSVPLITLGTDDQHGKFNKVWTMRADIDYEVEQFEGKKIPDLSTEELARLIGIQRGQPDAIFHEIHLKRHRGVVDLDTGLRAGHCPGLTKELMRFRRDSLIDHIDSHDCSFLSKIMDAFGMQHPFAPPTDDIAQPYPEEEIWTAMGDIKYAFVKTQDDHTVKLPNVIRDMAQDRFKFLNERVGDAIREILRPHPLEWSFTQRNALSYAQLRANQEKKLEQFQTGIDYKGRIDFPAPDYPYSATEVLSKKNTPDLRIEDVYSTMIQDKLYLMDKITETTRSYEVQQKIDSNITNRTYWQTIPFTILATMSESQILSLRNEGNLRIKFEKNPNRPAFRFAIRHFIENGMGDLLNQTHRNFYMAETSSYVNGPSYIQDPALHRIMSVPKIKNSLNLIRQNIKIGNGFYAATRMGEVGAYDTFVNDNLAESILENVSLDTHRREKRYPMTEKRKMDFGINPFTNELILNIKFNIPRTATIVQIPDAHTAITASHAQFGHTCLVIPYVDGLKKADHIVLQEEKSKRKFYAASPVLHALPSRESGNFERFFQTVDKAYTTSGHEPPKTGYVLSCEELAPISRLKQVIYPSLRIPQNTLMATRNPLLANLQRPDVLIGFMIRKYDLRFEKGQKILLRGTDSEGHETGWEASARISSKPLEISAADLLKILNDPADITKADMLAYKVGFGTSDDLKAHMLSEFTRFDEDIKSPENILMFVEIEPVKRISYWSKKQPRAAYKAKANTYAKIRHEKSRLAHKRPSLDLQ